MGIPMHYHCLSRDIITAGLDTNVLHSLIHQMFNYTQLCWELRAEWEYPCRGTLTDESRIVPTYVHFTVSKEH